MAVENFFKSEVPEILSRLNSDTPAQWGILTPQHMVEHLVSSWRISNGKSSAICSLPEDKLALSREFLFSDKPFKKNIKNPIMGDSLLPLRKADLNAAKQQLLTEIKDFFAYFEAQPNAAPVHPFFGSLDKQGWLTFQHKHLNHHFRQFSLIS